MQLIDLLSVFTSFALAAEEAGHAASDSSVLGTLGVNWKLLLAQLINFSLVMFVLWKWVFKPISNKLSERSEKIAIALKDAEDIENEKVAFNEWKESQVSFAREEAYTIISNAKKEAETLKAEILAQTQKEQSRIIEMGKSQLHEEAEIITKEIKTEMASLVVLATEKILKEKLDIAKDKEIIKKAIEEVLKAK